MVLISLLLRNLTVTFLSSRGTTPHTSSGIPWSQVGQQLPGTVLNGLSPQSKNWQVAPKHWIVWPSLEHLQFKHGSGCHDGSFPCDTQPLGLQMLSSHVGQHAPGLNVGLLHNGLAQRTVLQSVSQKPQHSPGGTMGLGHEGMRHDTALQSCLQVRQPLQLTGFGQNVSGQWTSGCGTSSSSSSSVQIGQQAPGLCVWLANGQSRGTQSTRVQSPSHCPQHSPGGMIGLGQGGLGQSLALQSSLQVLQQSHRTIGNGQNVSGHSAEPLQGGGGVGRPAVGSGSGTGLTGSSPRLSQVRQHLSSPNTDNQFLHK